MPCQLLMFEAPERSESSFKFRLRKLDLEVALFEQEFSCVGIPTMIDAIETGQCLRSRVWFLSQQGSETMTAMDAEDSEHSLKGISLM